MVKYVCQHNKFEKVEENPAQIKLHYNQPVSNPNHTQTKYSNKALISIPLSSPSLVNSEELSFIPQLDGDSEDSFLIGSSFQVTASSSAKPQETVVSLDDVFKNMRDHIKQEVSKREEERSRDLDETTSRLSFNNFCQAQARPILSSI